MPEYFQIAFLPWYPIPESQQLGPVTLWPFPEEAQQWIQDERLLGYLKRYFRSYVDHQGKPVDRITICSFAGDDFRRKESSEQARREQDLIRAVDALIFATITPGVLSAVHSRNPTMAPANANEFELNIQNFDLDSDSIAVFVGSRCHTGWKIGEITFPEPWTVGGLLGTADAVLLEGLNRCFAPECPSPLRERVFRSLEWFRLAHIEGGPVTAEAKVVMMSTAFEILLSFPAERKRKHFTDYMEQHIASGRFHRDMRTTQRGRQVDLSLAGCWAWDFYDLRSRIVHGDRVTPRELLYMEAESPLKALIPQWMVADLVFMECLKLQLFQQGYIHEEILPLLGKGDDVAEASLIQNWLGFSRIHKSLGWISMKVP